MAFADLMRQWDRACAQSDALFAGVTPAGFLARPIGERHRVLFYRGHLEAFDFNVLGCQALGVASCEAHLDALFARGIDPTDGDLPADTCDDWPKPAQIVAYATRAREALRDACMRHGGDQALAHTLQMLIEHRLMHIETLTYMLHQMPATCLRMHIEAPASVAASAEAPTMRRIAAGCVTLGQRRAGGAFGWDNEFEAQAQNVADFDIDTYPVTNADFIRFVQAGGYSARELWRPEDWTWVADQRRRQPHFWGAQHNGAAWSFMAFGQQTRLLPDAPVYVSFAEAYAYAKFCNKQLPTEAQWQRACTGTAEGREQLYPWGEAAPKPQHGHFGLRAHLPASVHAHPAGASAWGVHDMMGNGWEWTRTAFAPFAGFAARPDYPGYSADFFDDAHFVLKGGSMATAESLLRRSFRNWFQPHYPYIYAKFRCIREVP